jgi:hypothetical protein
LSTNNISINDRKHQQHQQHWRVIEMTDTLTMQGWQFLLYAIAFLAIGTFTGYRSGRGR